MADRYRARIAAVETTRPNPNAAAQRGLLAPAVQAVLASPGTALDAATRADLEPRFGQDFSGVRVHTDARAAASARALGASAYTARAQIAFAAARYAPQTSEGRGLLAHELAHVVQQRAGPQPPADTISRLGDADETGADRAVAALARGQRPEQLGAAGAAVQRAPEGQPSLALGPRAETASGSQSELVVENFLNRMWSAQSQQTQPFRITPKVLEGLNLLFPYGAPLGVITTFASPKELLDRLRPRLPSAVDPNVVKVLERIPAKETALPASAKTSGDPAAPALPPSGRDAAFDAVKPPAQSQGGDAAMKAALEAAFAEFRKTKIGQELEKMVKGYVFSVDGIPLDIFVVGTALTFVAANNPQLPSVPAIPLGNGVKLKIDYSGRVTDLPPLLRELVDGRTEPPGTPERRIAVGVTVTNEAAIEIAKAVGHFFAEAATWIGRGIVRAGTVIGKAARSILPELLAGLGGAGLGAAIGGLAGGGLGAGIGALIGAGVGVGAALIARAVTSP